ncbi:MAG: DNA adenine methylase [Candidatus Gracilibacteria bacterium]|nr:DNA adenine methylase [Candidatus Gracilibacteria bacterium]
MTTLVLNNLSQKFGLTFLVVKSWWEEFAFSSEKEAEIFFEENIKTIKAKPFIKWVGGKRQLISQFQELFPKDFSNYHEPFLGGGAVFFNLQKKKSYLSDVNEELINLYKTIKKEPEELIKFLESLEYSKEKFLELRFWDRLEGGLLKFSKIQRAGRFMYLNRTCFNGLYRVNSRGEFNVPFGKYTNPDFIQKENIINTSKLLNKTKAQIRLQSFEKVLEKVNPGDFVYFDPPYDVLTDSANFTSYDKSGFGRDMQEKLAEICRKLEDKGVKFMLSNHNTPFIREIYSGFNFDIVKARRNINSKASGRGDEIVNGFFNFIKFIKYGFRKNKFRYFYNKEKRFYKFIL